MNDFELITQSQSFLLLCGIILLICGSFMIISEKSDFMAKFTGSMIIVGGIIFLLVGIFHNSLFGGT